MKILASCCLLIAASLFLSFSHPASNDGWISLFDGNSLSGWSAGDNAESFSVDSGRIVVHGKTSHLFYSGPVKNHDFKNFEFKAEVMTMPGANSGIYFHTEFQQGGWPKKGYEVQVNNSHTDWKRTGSLYNIVDVKDVLVKDGEWFTEYIKVEGKRVIIKVNDKTVVDYTEPENVSRDKGQEQRLISNGTFALQAHDPNSVVYFRNIKVKA
ncbi:MAG TPA: DUF1080 domain-containing protein [Chitinophagaceae bacterium]|nr:DUF1080 domain-containing protein [Chitinophagaceae bacterium]